MTSVSLARDGALLTPRLLPARRGSGFPNATSVCGRNGRRMGRGWMKDIDLPLRCGKAAEDEAALVVLGGFLLALVVGAGATAAPTNAATMNSSDVMVGRLQELHRHFTINWLRIRVC